MVAYASLISTVVLFAHYTSGRPTPDSSSGDEVAVSAPYGVIMSDTAELSSQLASESAAASGSGSAEWWSASTTSPSRGYAATSSPYASPAYSDSWKSSAVASADKSMMTEVPSLSSSSGHAISSAVSSHYDKSTAAATASYVSSPAALSSSVWSSSSLASAWYSSATPSYGSGSSNWGGSSYDNCVQQCVASFGSPSSMTTATPPPAAASASSTVASGSTITVIVAPTQGILRYVPFVVNASVGDTVEYVWGANNHTVTKSSELAICNKTADAPFASGEQNTGFTFTQVVNDTQSVFFYCGTPGHCEKGMFGIINPPSIDNANTSVSTMMSAMAANDSSMAAMSSYASQQTSGNAGAAGWGSNIDMSSVPEWAYSSVMENVMYTRMVLAANPSVMQPDGSIDLSAGGSLSWPADITSAVASNTTSSASASVPSSTRSATPASSNVTNGATSTAMSRGVLAVTAIVAAFLVL